MPTLDAITDQLTRQIEQAISVIVVRRDADSAMQPNKIALGNDAAEAFRGLCRATVDGLRACNPTAYTADAELDLDEVFVLDDHDSLAELNELQSLLAAAATLPTVAPRDLDLTIQFYAVVVGDDSRVLLLRRANPHIRYRGGRFLAVAGEQLRTLDEPAFSFAPGFDIIVADDWVVVLNQPAFERLFREIGVIDRHIATWVAGITDYLPMDETSIEMLQKVAKTDSRTWRRLREIYRRGHLATVRLDEVRQYATRVELEPEHVVRNGRLVFDPADRFSFLHLLNEDLYSGPLTDETFEAQRKASTAA